MKAQTKALVASLIIVALGLSAVSGITYSWFSDSQDSTITVNTGYVKASTSNFAITEGSTVIKDANGPLPDEIVLVIGSDNSWTPNETGGRLSISDNPDDLHLTISYEVKFEWSIPYKYNVGIIIPDEIVSSSTITDESGEVAASSGCDNTVIPGSKVLNVKLNITKLPQNYDGTIKLDNRIAQYNALYIGGCSLVPFEDYREDGTEQTFEISTAEELAGFGYMVNVNGSTFIGKTVKLCSDIDLQNISWTPIGQTKGHEFHGTFNGNGYTITNMNVDVWHKEPVDLFNDTVFSSGLFGWAGNKSNPATIENVTITNSTVSGHHNVGAVCGYLESGSITDCVVKKTTIKNTTKAGISGADGDKTGGIVGFVNSGSVKECDLFEVTIYTDRDGGMIVGCTYSSNESNIDGSWNSSSIDVNFGAGGSNVKKEKVGRVI